MSLSARTKGRETMRKSKVFGVIVALFAVVALVAGVIGATLESNTGALGEKLAAAKTLDATISANEKAAQKTAPATVKKAATAVSAADKALEKAESALESIAALQTKLAEEGLTGDELIDRLHAAATEAATGLDGADETLNELSALLGGLLGEGGALSEKCKSLTSSIADARVATEDIDVLANGMVLSLFEELALGAESAVTDAEEKTFAAQEAVASVYAAVSLPYEYVPVTVTEKAVCESAEECLEAAKMCVSRAEELIPLAAAAASEADGALNAAREVSEADEMSLADRAMLFVDANWMGFLFTAALLALAAVVLFFFAESFRAAWRKNPVFSTGVAVLVMIAIQTYALGFHYESVGEWLSYWFNNAMNVLRANSSVGMIALGMTFVIISGGIDLAVGSTLAGIATVVMCLIDVSQNGALTKAGITGLPAYLIASAMGVVVGIALGSITGLVVTKGRVPPFIVTLGMMQIVRSVAQYFTKSYTPEVPKAFQALANTTIGGQMLLPIVYWLALAAIMYIVSKHTTFGRHVYAIGSNERTTMLSGINVNKVKMKVYILMGFIVSLAAITQVARLRGVDVSSAGNGYEMNAIAAVIVGGTSMAGGRGSIVGTVLGVLIIGIMNNLLVLLSVDSFLSSAFTGVIVIAAVLMQRKEKNA